jgi:rubredoxin
MKIVEKVVPAKPARTVIKFQCEKCGTIYRYKSQAEKCEALEIEPQLFKIGDRVTFSNSWIRCSKTLDYHRADGKIYKITGPNPLDDYPNNDSVHYYKYFIEFVCPFCRVKFLTYARASSMKLISRK